MSKSLTPEQAEIYEAKLRAIRATLRPIYKEARRRAMKELEEMEKQWALQGLPYRKLGSQEIHEMVGHAYFDTLRDLKDGSITLEDCNV